MWALVQPGDVALVPEPSYPIHIYAPVLAGAEVRRVPIFGEADDVFASLAQAFSGFLAEAPGDHRVVPPQSHDRLCRPFFLRARLVDFAREHEVMLVSDLAYADVAYDGYRPPSLLEVEGATDVAVELYSMTKGHSMPGWLRGR